MKASPNAPHPNSQTFLEENTKYRVTLVCGPGHAPGDAVCSDSSGVPMTYFETSDRSKRREMAKTFEKLQVVK